MTREPVTSLGLRELEELAVGCTVLAGGGGGDPRVGLMMAVNAVQQHGPVPLIQLDDLSDTDNAFAAGMIGAPTVMVEKIPNGNEGSVVQGTLQARLGKTMNAMMPLEMGGINGVLPVAWAVNAGLPLVDGDLMGRAFPELQMCTPHLHGILSSPSVLVDERSQAITFETAGNVWLERLMRNTVSVLGGGACAGLYPMSGAVMRDPVIRGTVSTAVRIGRAVSGAGADPFEAMSAEAEVYPLITGKVIDVERRTAGGFVRGSAVIEGTEADSGRLVRVEFQNENLVAMEDGEPVATVPDIITLLDRHTAHGIVTEHIRYGQRVILAVFRGPSQWRGEEGLRVVGPRAFGYDVEFKSVEERYAQIH